MEEQAQKSLWREPSGNPVLKLGRAMALSALALTLLAVVFRTMVGLISGLDAESAYQESAATFETAGMVAFLFTGTFGVVGVLLLWWFTIRNMVVWAFLGGTLGAIAGAIFGASNPTELGAACLGGWAMFLCIRWLASVRD